MIELPMLSYKHRPESFGNGVYEINSKRGEIGKSEISNHLATNLAGIGYECGMLRYSQLSHGYKRQKW